MMFRRPDRSTKFVPVFLLALGFFSSTAAAQSKPDFSGTWKPLQQSAQVTISQDGPSFVVTTTRADGSSETLAYRLDGSESRNITTDVRGAVWTHVSRATWMNSAVVITTTTNGGSKGKWEWMRVYSLKGDDQLSVTTFDGVLTDARLTDTSTVSYGKAARQ